MNKYILSLAILLSIKINSPAQSYGLSFNSHEVVLEKRTALDLSPEDSFCFSKPFELNFEFRFIPNHQIYFGYIVRIITSDSRNIDLIYNQPSASFKVITGESFSGISFTIDSLKLYKQWNRFQIRFDSDQHTLSCLVNGRLIGSGDFNLNGACFKVLFGANDFQKFKTRDLPPIQVKDIRILEKDEPKYFWPMDESQGDSSYDKIGHKLACIKNPEWIKPAHQKWETIGSFRLNGYAGVAYDPAEDRLYVAGTDSIAVYTLKNEMRMDWSPTHHQNLQLGHQFIYDTSTKKLFDIYIDQRKVPAYDFAGQHWDFTFPPQGWVTEYWHYNKFISPADSFLYMMGGYGYLRYKNKVRRYQFSTGKWDSLSPSGDYFSPRYLAALGTDAKGKYAYILGGYGSQTGDQMLDPKYYYDLLRYDIRNNSFKRLFSLKPLTTPFTFANSLVIDSNAFYGLVFSNDSFNSNLQLIQGSLKDSSFRLMGSPIPYNFHDIQSFADLYYSPVSNKLIAVTLFYSPNDSKEKNTDVKIYTLNFPPEPMDSETAVADKTTGRSFWTFIAAGLLLGAVGYQLFRYRRAKAGKQEAAVPPVAAGEVSAPAPAVFRTAIPGPAPHSAIFLFGQFQVFDKEGNDITRSFTPLLKELFLIICIYTLKNGRGISSEKLNEILWHDKSEKDAKNNRSVNIAKLKTILEKIGNCVINKESGYWQLVTGDEVYIDYRQFVGLVQPGSSPDKEYINAVLDIIRRGAFLTQTEYNWLDNIKSDVSNAAIDVCLDFVRTQELTKDPEFIIEITNYIFYFDQLNEDALIYRCKCLILLKRHTLANNSYLRFIKDYKDIYGEEFPKSFHEIIT